MRTIKTDKNKKHRLVKCLLDKGYKNIILIYEPYFSPDWGWTLVSVDAPKGVPKNETVFGFLGYNILESLNAIKKIKPPSKKQNNKHQ